MGYARSISAAARRLPGWPIHAASLAYAAWVFWSGAVGRLGPDPVKAIEQAYGDAALYLLVAGLCITPLRRFAGVSLLQFRRPVGLACFFFATVHLLIWAVLDVQALDRVWADIVKRPYISVGMSAWLLLLPLALTSNNLSVRRLGPAWRRLHRLVYPAAILAAAHYVMLVKGLQLRPLVFLAVILALLILRLPRMGALGKGREAPRRGGRAVESG